MQDIQFHPVTDSILHVDFYQLFKDKEVTMDIPVRLLGNSPGVRNGGRLLFRKRKLAIKALPDNLPDFFDAVLTDEEDEEGEEGAEAAAEAPAEGGEE